MHNSVQEFSFGILFPQPTEYFFWGKILCLLALVSLVGSQQPKRSLAIKEKTNNWVNTRIIWKAEGLSLENQKTRGRLGKGEYSQGTYSEE